jgi:hypothetical protein
MDMALAASTPCVAGDALLAQEPVVGLGFAHRLGGLHGNKPPGGFAVVSCRFVFTLTLDF